MDPHGEEMQLFESKTVRHPGPADRGDNVVHPKPLVEPIGLSHNPGWRVQKGTIFQ